MVAGQTVLAERYELGEALGRGGMATVFRAWDTRLGREVAIKVFGTDGRGAVPGDRAERRLREIRLLAGASHPHLVTLFDADWSSGADSQPGFLVMELVDGESLRRHIDRIGPDPELARRLIVELSGALAYLHAHGIVHRDLKPENILINAASGRLKLVDFGIAQLIGDAGITTVGTVLGTAAYLSPEQVAGEPAGGATDVYALGLVALETLTGQRAFPGPAVESAIARMTRDPAIPASLPEEWRELLAAMTAREAAARPSAASVSAEAETLPVPAPARTLPLGVSELAASGFAASDVATERMVVEPAAGADETDATAEPAEAAGAASAPGWSRERRGALAAAAATLLLASGAVALALASDHQAGAGADPPTAPPSPAPTITEVLVPQPAVTQTIVPAQTGPDQSGPSGTQNTGATTANTGPGSGNNGNGGPHGAGPGPGAGPGAAHGKGNGKGAH